MKLPLILHIFLISSLINTLVNAKCSLPKKQICTDELRDSVRCSTVYDPVCASFKEKGSSKIHQKLMSNACVACTDPSVLYYRSGPCHCSRAFCDANLRPDECTGKNNRDKPVCGYFTEGCPEGECPKTFPNACSACQDETIEYYRPGGACKSDTISCAVVLLPNPCDDNIDPVCARTEDGTLRTFENLCVACTEGADSLIKPGACEKDPRSFCKDHSFNCDDDETDPVCGYFRQGCPEGLCARNFDNACAACQDDMIINYEDGACEEGTEVLSCAAAIFPEECPGEREPVCAELPGNCPDSGCAMTFPNFCVQCQNAASSLARPGACPFSKLIFSDPNNRPESCDNDDIEPVCGYFSENCPQGLCPRTYDNACLARQDESVVAYEPGRCAEETLSCAVVLLPEVCPDDVVPVCTGTEPTTYDNLCKACKGDVSSLIKPGACRS